MTQTTESKIHQQFSIPLNIVGEPEIDTLVIKQTSPPCFLLVKNILVEWL